MRYFVENLVAKDFPEEHYHFDNKGMCMLPDFSQIDPEEVKFSIHQDFLFMRKEERKNE